MQFLHKTCLSTLFVGLIIAAGFGAWYYWQKKSSSVMVIENCIFCKILAKKVPATVIAENEEILVIKDINPSAPIHYLILPKKHIKDIQSFTSEDAPLMQQMMSMAQNLWKQNQQDFRLVVNSGKNAGQCVFHAHMHYLSGGILPTHL